MKTLFVPPLNESIQSAVKSAVEPLIKQINEQSETIKTLQEDNQMLKDDNRKIIDKRVEFEQKY